MRVCIHRGSPAGIADKLFEFPPREVAERLDAALAVEELAPRPGLDGGDGGSEEDWKAKGVDVIDGSDTHTLG